MDNTDIFLERCQVAIIRCEVHLVSGLTKELAVPFFKVKFPPVTTTRKGSATHWSSGPESRLYMT